MQEINEWSKIKNKIVCKLLPVSKTTGVIEYEEEQNRNER